MRNKKIFIWAIITSLFLSCNHQHAHDHGPEDEGLQPLSYTLYSDSLELFVEFKPLVVGAESNFATHLTLLRERFIALEEATVTLTLMIEDKIFTTNTLQPSSPGIFRIQLSPSISGFGDLSFKIQTKNFTDEISIKNIKIYENEVTALKEEIKDAEGDEVTYLKEQAWKTDFAHTTVKRQVFYNIIKTSGQILSAPGDEVVVTAKASGIVLFTGNKSIIGSEVNTGTSLFTISGGDLTQDNLDANYKNLKANYEKSKLDLNRAEELIIDKIISEREYQDIKLRFDNAQTAYNVITKSYTSKGQGISSPIKGFVKNIFVSEGQFVEVGTPLATISQNKKLVLQAHVSQRYFNKLPEISAANFKTMDGERVYNTKALNGKVISYGKSLTPNSPFIPITFEIDNIGNIIPGSVVEVYLQSLPIEDAIVVPLNCLIEEQGLFFVYVQTGGESFVKKEVKLGASDGLSVQILSGIEIGERIVTKGAFQIKLSSAAGTMPAHGHEH
jgi:membrane fusion protein, heavy metal efflux system